jgi:hypothetical protein
LHLAPVAHVACVPVPYRAVPGPGSESLRHGCNMSALFHITCNASAMKRASSFGLDLADRDRSENRRGTIWDVLCGSLVNLPN